MPMKISSLCMLLSVCHTVSSVAVDNDSDGIPGEWEEWRGLSDSDPSDALHDWDGDGLNSQLEFITQSRPWGNYNMQRLDWSLLPSNLDPSTIYNSQFITSNRSGEFIINFQGSFGTRSFLWTPPGGALLSSPVLIEIPEITTAVIPFNDNGEALVTNSSGEKEIRSLRDWTSGAAPVSWPPSNNPVALALSNDQRILVWTHWWSGSSDKVNQYEWRDTAGNSIGYQRFTYNPLLESHTLGVAADTLSGAWLFGESWGAGYPPPLLDSVSAILPLSGWPWSLGPFPTHAGATVAFSANGVAAGYARNYINNSYEAGKVSPAGWETINGGVAGSSPSVMGVSDNGMVLGQNNTDQPYELFLWRASAVVLSKARPEVQGGMTVAGLTVGGALYALDYGDNTMPPQPVAFLAAPSSIGDGIADESVVLTDADSDGIPDSRESFSGTGAASPDSDGDGFADLWELIAGRNPVNSESFPESGDHTGLQIHAPGTHRLNCSSFLE